MNFRTALVSTGFVAACLSVSLGAFAQEAAPPEGTAAPDPVAPPTGEPTPVTATAPGAAPLSTMEQSRDAHAEVTEHTWPNRPLLLTGGVLFVGTYAASVIVGATSDREADERLFLPVVGPWLDLKDRDCDVNACDNETLNKALLIGDGALQGVGALMMVLSLAIPESTKKPWYLIGSHELSVTPQIGGAMGIRASGSF